MEGDAEESNIQGPKEKEIKLISQKVCNKKKENELK